MLDDVVKKKLEAATKELLTENSRRGYIGASSIGNKCLRQAWYTFRWAYQAQHQGRLLRLFNRGHEEEHRIVRWLRAGGAEVQDYSQRLIHYDGPDHIPRYKCIDWDEEVPQYWEDVSTSRDHIALATDEEKGPKQWGFVDHDGHFAGHSDGRLSWPGVLPDGWGLAEFKTANDKSFKQMVAKGVISSKPVHWVQMQIYMHYFNLDWALYVMANKNDDDLYVEIVYRKPEIAQGYIDVAAKIIPLQDGPQRYSNDPSWYECKFCDYREICHYDDTPQKNCRSCQYAIPGPAGSWICNKFSQEIPKDFLAVGCNDWTPVK